MKQTRYSKSVQVLSRFVSPFNLQIEFHRPTLGITGRLAFKQKSFTELYVIRADPDPARRENQERKAISQGPYQLLRKPRCDRTGGEGTRMYSRQTCFLSVPHRRPRLDPEVTRKQDSDCFNSCHSFQSHHSSVLYVLATISISLKQ